VHTSSSKGDQLLLLIRKEVNKMFKKSSVDARNALPTQLDNACSEKRIKTKTAFSILFKGLEYASVAMKFVDSVIKLFNDNV
jgi:hypothetical protein